MKQTLVYLTEDQHEALRNRAHESRMSISEIVRTSIDLYLTREHPPMPRLPKKEAIKEAQSLINEVESKHTPIVKATDDAVGKIELDIAIQNMIRPHRCEAPGLICKVSPERTQKYLVEYVTDEGNKKKEVWLCAFHAMKARETSESVTELIEP